MKNGNRTITRFCAFGCAVGCLVAHIFLTTAAAAGDVAVRTQRAALASMGLGTQVNYALRHGGMPGANATRYTQGSRVVPAARAVSGGLNAAARGIRHPALMAAAYGLSYMIDDDGEVREIIWDGELPEGFREPSPGVTYGWCVATSESAEVCSGPAAPTLAAAVQQEVDTLGGWYHAPRGTAGEGRHIHWCFSSTYQNLAECVETGNTNLAFTTSRYLFLNTNLDLSTWEDDQIPEGVGSPVDVQDFIDALTPEQIRDILQDIISTRDDGHPWHQVVPGNMTTEYPVPPEVVEQIVREHENLWAELAGDPPPHPDDTPDSRTPDEEAVERWDDPPPDFPDGPELEWQIEEIDQMPDWDSGVGEGSCPAPHEIPLPLGWGTVQISYDPACDLADMLRPIVLALGAIVSLFIVVRTGD